MRNKMMKGLVLSTLSMFALGAIAFVPATANAEEVNEWNVTLSDGNIAIGEQAAENVTVNVNGTQETVAYDMQDGASVRLSAPTGIRFASFISRQDYEGLQTKYGKENVEIGTIIVEAENYSADGFVVGGENVGKITADKISLFDEENGILRFCATINTLPENVYDVKLYAKSYVAVTIEGTTYYGYTDFTAENQRNIDEVATNALLDATKTWSDSDRYLLEDFAADKKEGKVYVDTSSAEWVTAFGATATKAYSADDEEKTSVQVTQAALEAIDAATAGNDEAARTKTVTVYTEDDVYTQDVILASLVIKTKDQLLNWQNYTVKGAEKKTGDTTLKLMKDDVATEIKRTYYAWDYDGYVVLGANITLADAFGSKNTFLDLGNSDIVCTEGFKAGGSTYGFKGIFDGCGYTISGGVYGTAGLFGGIRTEGIVRNLAITNAKVADFTFAAQKFADGTTRTDGVGKNGNFNTDATRAWAASGVIADTITGTMENCLIEATRYMNFEKGDVKSGYNVQITNTFYDAENNEYLGYFSYGGKMMLGFANSGTTKNCVFNIKSTNTQLYYNLSNKGSCENVFMMVQKVSQNTSNQLAEGFIRYDVNATVTEEMVAALTAPVWDLTVGEAPKFKTK